MFVVSRETCPSQARIVLISTPARSKCVAVVWRIVCGLIRLAAREGRRALALATAGFPQQFRRHGQIALGGSDMQMAEIGCQLW